MKRKMLLGLLVVVCLFTIVGCGKSTDNKVKDADNKEKEEEKLIQISDKDKGYETTFKTINNKFSQKDPKYKQVNSEELGVFISFQYIESTKEEYDYAKTHNFLGYEYSKDEIKDYTWNKYSGYTYNVKEKEMSFRILLVDDKDKSVILSGYIGDKHTKDLDLTKDFDNEDFQKFFNSIEFKKES